MHDVAILALHGVVPFDLAIPCEVFGRTRVEAGNAYRVRVCGEGREVRAGVFTLRAPWDLQALAGARTVVIPGVEDPTLPVPDAVVEAIRAAAGRGARIASVCTGAFVLAATGLLDGRRATTHWKAAALLKARHPAVTVNPDVLYIDDGAILTSAGASAGLDLCLHMVRRDYGEIIAAEAARLAVAPLDREGGQAQFIHHEAAGTSESLALLLEWMAEHAARPLTVDEIARQAALSTRTLARRFREQTGSTPLQWLLAARVRNARRLLETTRLSIEEVAAAVGFDTAGNFRERFHRTMGVSPARYRRTFGADGPGVANPTDDTCARESQREHRAQSRVSTGPLK